MEEKSQFIQEIKQLIGDARLETAIDRFIAYLEKKGGYEDLARTALHLRADFQKTTQEEIRGVLGRDDAKVSYNQITDRLLKLLGVLAKDPPRQRARRNGWIAVAVAGLLLVIAGGWFLYRQKNNNPDQPTALIQTDCPPQFNAPSNFKILCLPFLDYNQDALQSGISKAIQNRLSRLSSDYAIETSAGLYRFASQDTRRYPSAPEDADGFGANCDAQLVIWGSFEDQPDNDIITTNWRLVNQGAGFRLRKLGVEDEPDADGDTVTTLIDTWGYEVDTITSITSVATQGVLTERIENLLLLLFGIISHQTDNRDAAIATLENVKPNSEAELILRNCLLADNYLAADQPEKAMVSYDEVLEKKPEYSLALNNRALLNYRKGRYEEAAQDLTTQIEQNPDDSQARIARGSAYLKAEQLDKAGEDFQEAKKTEKNNPVLQRREIELKEKVSEQRTLREQAENTLRNDPNNLRALNALAESSSKLGDHLTAARASEQIIAQDPRNVSAFSNLVRSYNALQLNEKVEETLQKAARTGIRSETIRPQVLFPIKARIDTSRQ